MDELFRFDTYTGELVPTPALDGPDVLDSWLLVDGRVRCLEWHEQRFAEAVPQRHPVEEAAIKEFLHRVREMLPWSGTWLPRIECSSVGDLGLRLWRAPEPAATVRLWTASVPDPREEPGIKGPDQRCLTEIRRIAGYFAADEAVLLDARGYVREGACSALAWWRGSTLCFPDLGQPVLPSVTRQLVEIVAGMRGVSIEYEEVRPADIAGLAVWVLGAQHGIREAVSWSGRPAPASTDGAREVWQHALDHFAIRIDNESPYPGEIQHA